MPNNIYIAPFPDPVGQTVRDGCLLTVFCYTNTQLINPEAIDNLMDTWQDINVILTKISSLKTSVQDDHKRGITVPPEDYL